MYRADLKFPVLPGTGVSEARRLASTPTPGSEQTCYCPVRAPWKTPASPGPLLFLPLNNVSWNVLQTRYLSCHLPYWQPLGLFACSVYYHLLPESLGLVLSLHCSHTVLSDSQLCFWDSCSSSSLACLPVVAVCVLFQPLLCRLHHFGLLLSSQTGFLKPKS